MGPYNSFEGCYSLKKRTYIFGKRLAAVVAHLSDIEYAKKQANESTCCVDIFAANPNGDVRLGVRLNAPSKGLWWPPGGRKYRNETPGEAATRHFKKDYGLAVDPDRFAFLNQTFLLFDDREQEPKEVGTDSPVTVVGLLLTKEESDTLSDIGELKNSRFVSREEQFSMDLHPYVRDSIDHLHTYQQHACRLGRDRP